MAALSNIVRVDVREALLRPDFSPIRERETFWYVRVPQALVDGASVASGGAWSLLESRSLATESARDPMTRALLELYALERADMQRAAPWDPNFTAPLRITWMRLPHEAAMQRPFANTHCLELDREGHLKKTSADLDVELVELS